MGSTATLLDAYTQQAYCGNDGVQAGVALKKLCVLVLRGCTHVNASVTQRIKQMPNLEDLDLMSNPWLDVTDDVIGDFLSLSGLQVLKLGDMHHGNVLNEKGMEMLAELDGLKSFSLAFFNWSAVKPI